MVEQNCQTNKEQNRADCSNKKVAFGFGEMCNGVFQGFVLGPLLF